MIGPRYSPATLKSSVVQVWFAITKSIGPFSNLSQFRYHLGVRLPSFLLVERDRADDDQPLYQVLIPRADVEDDQDVIGEAHEQHAAKRAD